MAGDCTTITLSLRMAWYGRAMIPLAGLCGVFGLRRAPSWMLWLVEKSIKVERV